MTTQMLPHDHTQMLDAVDPRHEPVLRSLAVDQAGAYAEEVRLLRRKVATLEAALVAAHAARINDHQGACRHTFAETEPAESHTPCAALSSEFVPPQAPAVVPIGAAETTVPTPRVVAELDPLEFAAAANAAATAAFAAAWVDDEATFEERFAAKAFFQAGTVDEPSREWLLSDDQG